MVHLIKFLSIAIFLSGCGANVSIGLSETDSEAALGRKITGTAITTSSEEINLVEDIEKDTLVLIFAQDTCTTCSEEANEISQKIEEIGDLPKNVRLITFLVGLVGDFALEDARDWKDNHNAQWDVVVQKGDENLFKKYFPDSVTVPAILIQKNGEILFQHSGALGIEELESKTGEWE